MGDITRIVFWIVALCICLQAMCAPAILPAKNTDLHFQQLRDKVVCPDDTLLYSPKAVSEKRECIISALNCTIFEFKGPVKEECTDPGNSIQDILEVLGEIIDSLKNQTKCPCEISDQITYKKFVSSAQTLLQQVSAMASDQEDGGNHHAVASTLVSPSVHPNTVRMDNSTLDVGDGKTNH